MRHAFPAINIHGIATCRQGRKTEMRRYLVLVGILTIVLGAAGPAFGQAVPEPEGTGPARNPTPTASLDAGPSSLLSGIPAPADCRVAPRSPEDISALLATPTPTGSPEAVPDRESWEFLRADDATANAAALLVWDFIACVNAGDRLREAALLTDNAVRARFADAEAGGQRPVDPATAVPIDRPHVIEELYLWTAGGRIFGSLNGREFDTEVSFYFVSYDFEFTWQGPQLLIENVDFSAWTMGDPAFPEPVDVGPAHRPTALPQTPTTEPEPATNTPAP
jgi:hypothetical protein